MQARSPEAANIDATAVAHFQEQHHGALYDYERGSPHLRHNSLRNAIVARIRQLINEQFVRHGECRVLEIGGGHGGFSDHVAASGAELTITEMSRASLELLQTRFAWNPRVQLLYDPDGEAIFSEGSAFHLVLCVSVLHHVPDYQRFVDRLTMQITEGGTFASFQDPMWYPRRGFLNMQFDRAAFYVWRLGQSNLKQGASTLMRRIRGRYDEQNPADMVEYHVVRRGVDEAALARLLRMRFADVDQWRYWSTQSALLQTLGARTGMETTFGIVGRARFSSTL